MSALQNTVGRNYYVYELTMTTTGQTIAEALGITEFPDGHSLDDANQVTFRNAETGCQISDIRGDVYFDLPTSGTTAIPVRNALKNVMVKASSGTPKTIVEIFT